MKGQAFIEFPDTSLAAQALDRIHGVVIAKKPLIVVSMVTMRIELEHSCNLVELF